VDGAGAGGGKKGKKGSAIDDIFASTKKEKAAAAVKEQVRDVSTAHLNPPLSPRSCAHRGAGRGVAGGAEGS